MVDKSHKTCEADRWFAQYGNALLLQEAMWKEGKFDAAKVRSLLTRTPAVVKKVNQEGKFPLHLAVAHNASAEVIAALLQAHPKAALMPDQPLSKGGRLPLHVALENKSETKVVIGLLEAHPAAARLATKTIFHCDLCNLCHLYHDYRRRRRSHAKKCGGRVYAKHGDLPLHKALENSADSEVVASILKAHPSSARMALKTGKLPLHVAVEKEASAEHVAALLQAYPAATLVASKDGCTPFQLWASSSNCNSKHLDTVQQLLRSLPSGEFDERGTSNIGMPCICTLQEIFGAKFDAFDQKKQGTLESELAARLALSIRVSLQELKLPCNKPIARAKFVEACKRLAIGGPNLLVLRSANKVKETNVKEAPGRATEGFLSIRSVGTVYQFVKQQRQSGPFQEIAAFKSLVDILRQQKVSLGRRLVHVENLQMIARLAEEESVNQHDELRACQSEIQRCVEAFELLDNQIIESVKELPDEIKQKMQNRDLLLSDHAKQGRQILNNLLQVAIDTSKSLSLSGDVETWPDFETNVLAYMKAREDSLDVAIRTARQSRDAYNQSPSRMNARRSLMGEHQASHSESSDALTSYDTWSKTYLSNDLANESDKAITALKVALADDGVLTAVLGINQKAGKKDSMVLEQAFISAGSAIAYEREHQLRDALSVFPCAALLREGLQCMESYQTEHRVIQHLVQVSRMVQKDLRVNEQSLGGEVELSLMKGSSTGGKESEILKRDLLVEEIQSARRVHKTTVRNLNTLTPLIAEGDGEAIRSVSQALGIQDLPNMSTLRRDVRLAHDDLTRVMQKLTGAMQQHFPEIILFMGKGLPSELGQLWQPSQSLDTFDEKERVPNQSRHGIWRVRLGEAWFAIKEYSISDTGDLRTFLKEAALIYRHRHHAIVEIQALFQDVHRKNLYMQMPWYEYGSLHQWLSGDQRPWSKVRSVLLDALNGLAHLHENLVLHGDIKPDNILVDNRERGRLADFDISIDTMERTSAARVISNARSLTVRATALGMTTDFAAPELLTSCQATKHTDMFAYGKTVELVNLNGQCEPPSDHADGLAEDLEARGQTEELVRSLTSEKAEYRLSANETICSPFFSTLNKMRRKPTRTCLFCESMGEESVKDADAGIECSEGHFHCCSCVLNLTQDLLKIENSGKRVRQEGHVMCFKYPTECRSAGFHDRDLARHLSVQDFQAYLKARIKLMEQKLTMELEAQIREQLQEEQRRLASLEEHQRKVLSARKHIEEEILQMKCPRCRIAFYDFEGCLAISCSTCPCKFCGWCFEDCGDNDAHPHVQTCIQVPKGVDAFFPQMPDVLGAFEKAHNRRCRELIDKYLLTLDEDVRGDVKRTVQVHL